MTIAPRSNVITAVVDDLAALRVDAVVRPAGESLEPAGTVAARLDQVAGGGFADQRRVSSPLEAGAAVVTGGGDLSAPFVIHAVIRDSNSPAVRAKIAPGAGLRLAAGRRLGAAAHRRRRPSAWTAGGLSLEDAAALLVETFPRDTRRVARRALHRGGAGGGPGGGGGDRAEVGVIRLTDLTKRYGKFTAVDGISLEVPRGELFGLLGPERRRQDHHHADDRRHPPADQRHGPGRRRRHAGAAAGGQGAARLHPRPALRLRQADRRRVPPVRRGALRPGRAGGGAPDRRAARAVRADAPGSTS